MRCIVAILAFLLCPVLALAAPKKHDRTFWELAAADIGMNSLDVATSLHDQSAYHTYEQNPIFGHHPGAARFTVQYAVQEAAYLYLAYRINRHHPRIARVLLLGDMSVEGVCLRNNFRAMHPWPVVGPGVGSVGYPITGIR